MKHINDILNESILDNDLGNKADEQVIRNWIIKQLNNVEKMPVRR